MIYNEQDLEQNAVNYITTMVVAAIKTAPKGKGINSLKTFVVTGEDKNKIAEYMKTKTERASFKRDAGNIIESDAVILIGVKKVYIGLDCGLCGYPTCAEAQKADVYCVFNTIDFGIAIGSAVSSLGIFKIDNRVMYTIGVAVNELKLMPEEYQIIMGIPLKVSNKNIFFDRK